MRTAVLLTLAVALGAFEVSVIMTSCATSALPFGGWSLESPESVDSSLAFDSVTWQSASLEQRLTASTRWRMTRSIVITVGMPEDEVEALLGPPTSDGLRAWSYCLSLDLDEEWPGGPPTFDVLLDKQGKASSARIQFHHAGHENHTIELLKPNPVEEAAERNPR